jgi:hypothetical protein
MRHALDQFYFSDPPVSGSRDFDVLRLGNHLVSICESEGWTCQIAEGPDLWKETIAAEGGWVNPTFDPDKSPVDETNSASVIIRDQAGDFVACNGFRLFLTDSFKTVLSSGELFYGPSMRLLKGLPVILPNDFQDLSGKIGYSGGTMISVRHRARRLGLLLTRLVRLIGERVYAVDHHAGNIFQNQPNDPHPRHPYHFARCTVCMPYMRIPDRREDRLIFLLDSSRAEFLAQVSRDVRKLVGKGNKTLDDLALLVA